MEVLDNVNILLGSTKKFLIRLVFTFAKKEADNGVCNSY